MKLNPIIAITSSMTLLAISAFVALGNGNAKAQSNPQSPAPVEMKTSTKTQNKLEWQAFKIRIENAIKTNDYAAFQAVKSEVKALHDQHKAADPNEAKEPKLYKRGGKKGNWKVPTEAQQKAWFDSAVAQYAKNGTLPTNHKAKAHGHKGGHGNHGGRKGQGMNRNNQVVPSTSPEQTPESTPETTPSVTPQ
jgi:hypothetical protein